MGCNKKATQDSWVKKHFLGPLVFEPEANHHILRPCSTLSILLTSLSSPRGWPASWPRPWQPCRGVEWDRCSQLMCCNLLECSLVCYYELEWFLLYLSAYLLNVTNFTHLDWCKISRARVNNLPSKYALLSKIQFFVTNSWSLLLGFVLFNLILHLLR